MSKKVITKISSIFVYTLTAILVILLIMSLVSSIQKKAFFLFNHSVVHIQTPSMQGAIDAGSYILIEKVEVEDIKEQDIITFYSIDPRIAGSLNTHRVIRIEEIDGKINFVTKGDNNTLEDQYLVSADKIVGRYVKTLNGLSSIMNFITQPFVFLSIVIIPCIFLFIKSIINLKKNIDEDKNKPLSEEEKAKLIALEVEKLFQEDQDKNENI